MAAADSDGQDIPATSQLESDEESVLKESPSKTKGTKEDQDEQDEAAAAKGATTYGEGMDNLLQKQRSEILVELHQMTSIDRPVSGQDSRRSVEDFFRQNADPDHSKPSDHNRPESVTVEVNALVDRRPVTSVLQSRSFRRNLESALRGAVNQVHGPEDRFYARSRQSRTSQPPRQDSPLSVENGAEPRRSSSTPETASRQQIHTARAADSDEAGAPPPRRTRTAEWLNEQREPEDESGIAAWESVERAQREEFVMEVSELVHRHLVTSSLSGTFRSRLESLVEGRVHESGTDGRRVQQFVNSLPRNQFIQRNDFSHLGINDNDLPSSASDISIISATAAVTVPANQTNAAMSREIHALKTQLQQLQNMMKMSFDIQMDIQRSIRQEVAAAMTAVASGHERRPASQPAAAGCCLICLDKTIDTVLYQCGHMCVCMTCGLQLVGRGAHCPVCRAPIREVIRAYKSSEK